MALVARAARQSAEWLDFRLCVGGEDTRGERDRESDRVAEEEDREEEGGGGGLCWLNSACRFSARWPRKSEGVRRSENEGEEKRRWEGAREMENEKPLFSPSLSDV